MLIRIVKMGFDEANLDAFLSNFETNKNKIRNIVKDENPKNKIIITKLKDKELEKNCVLTPKFKSNLT